MYQDSNQATPADNTPAKLVSKNPDAQIAKYYLRHGSAKTLKHFGLSTGRLYGALHREGVKLESSRRAKAKPRREDSKRKAGGTKGGKRTAVKAPNAATDAVTYLLHARKRLLEASRDDIGLGATLGLVCLALEALGYRD